MSDTSGRRTRRKVDPMFVAVLITGAALMVFAVSAVVVTMRGDDEPELASLSPTSAGETTGSVPSTSVGVSAGSTLDTGSVATIPPSTLLASEPPTPAATTAATTAATAVPTSSSAPTSSSVPESSVPTSSSLPTPPTSGPESSADVPESRAVVRGGKIFLEGAVPNEEVRDQIVALASEILGPDNVVDGYFVDPRASDPNLGQVRVADAVLFESESAVIAPEFEPLLNQGLALLTIRPAASFVVFGHTDSLGSDEYNDQLSQDRAQAVVEWYVERGIEASRLTAVGRGEQEPIALNDTSEGREQNRRIEVSIENLLAEG